MKHFSKKYSLNKEKYTASELIENCLDGSDYDRGVLETASAQAVNTTQALGRLVELLHQKGVLEYKDVCYVAEGISHDEDE